MTKIFVKIEILEKNFVVRILSSMSKTSKISEYG